MIGFLFFGIFLLIAWGLFKITTVIHTLHAHDAALERKQAALYQQTVFLLRQHEKNKIPPPPPSP